MKDAAQERLCAMVPVSRDWTEVLDRCTHLGGGASQQLIERCGSGGKELGPQRLEVLADPDRITSALGKHRLHQEREDRCSRWKRGRPTAGGLAARGTHALRLREENEVKARTSERSRGGCGTEVCLALTHGCGCDCGRETETAVMEWREVTEPLDERGQRQQARERANDDDSNESDGDAAPPQQSSRATQ